MPQYRRDQTPGATYFFTVVTYQRRKLLTHAKGLDILRKIIAEVRREYPFIIDGWVLLPDHLHCLWTLPEADRDFSKRWGLIKSRFTRQTKEIFHSPPASTPSKEKHREGTIWQRRFWEHRLRDEDDFAKHLDYIHYNPVKHGLVKSVKDWPYSTFHRYVDQGVYLLDWGDEVSFPKQDTFGE